MLEFSPGIRLVETYLYQPYSWFLGRNSSDMGKSVLSEVKVVIDKVIIHTMTLIAQSAAVIALLLLLVLVDPVLAITVGSVLILSYVLIYKLMRSFVSRIGSERVQAKHDRFSLPAQTNAKHQASL
jgi:ABC-type multidrug transport system fused ATPase/permease subunit